MSKGQTDVAKKQSSQGIIHVLEAVQKIITAFFIFTLPIVFYVLNTDMSYPKVIYSFGMISLLLILWGVQASLQREFRLNLPTLFWPGMLLIAAGTISIINATSVGTVLQSLATLVYFFLFYVYIANTSHDKRTFCLYFAAAMLAMFPIAVYVLMQKYNVIPGGVINTLIGTMGNPVAIAQYLNSMLIVGLLLFIGRISGWMKVLLLGAFAAGFGTFFATNTTGPLLSLIASLGLFALGLLLFRKSFRPLSQIKGWLFATVVVMILGIVLIGQPNWSPIKLGQADNTKASAALKQPPAENSTLNAAMMIPPVFKQFDQLINIWQRNSGDLRTYYWLVGLEMFKAQPLFGIGLGHYKVQYATYGAKLIQTPFGQEIQQRLLELRERHPTINLAPAQAHNEYVQVLAEMGLLGITAVVLMLGLLLWSGLQKLRTESNAKKQLMFLLLYVGAFTFVADSLFNFPGHLPASSMNLILFLGLAHSRYFYSQARGFKLKNGWRHALAVVVIVMSVSVSVLAYRDWQANLKMEVGIEYLSNSLYSLAQTEFEQSLALDFEPSATLYYLGLIHVSNNDFTTAKTFFEKSLRTRVFEDTLWKLSSINFQEQNYEATRNYLANLRAMFPNADTFLEATYLEALTELRLGNPERAIEIAEDTLDLYPDYGSMHLALGEIALSTQDYERAYDSYQQGLVYVNTVIDDLIIYLDGFQNPPDAGLQQLRQTQLQRDEIVRILEQLAAALGK